MHSHSEDADVLQPAHLIPLRREAVPVLRKGKIASFKTSYSGIIEVGNPPQKFRVVFDTGSGHIVLPAVECQSETCRLHRQYNTKASETAVPINLDNSVVEPGDVCDQVTIGYGTGKVTGEFVRDQVCISNSLCMEMNLVVATDMSPQPFKSFNFDGIFGLGLSRLALSPSFSFLDVANQNKMLQSSYFAVYLREDEDGEESEIALGGYNPLYVGETLTWTSVTSPELGFWFVQVMAVRVDGQNLDICSDGTCRGIVDTGSSHLGIPASQEALLSSLLTTPAGDLLDCRRASAPKLEIEVPGATLTLDAEDYMRRLPLRPDVQVSSPAGVMIPGGAAKNATTNNPSSEKLLVSVDGAVDRDCRPKLLSVNLPAPLGPNLFILGEPLLHRYYTIFDSKDLRIGFSRMHDTRLEQVTDQRGLLPKDVDVLLLQETLTTIPRGNTNLDDDLEDEFALFQLTVIVRKRV